MQTDTATLIEEVKALREENAFLRRELALRDARIAALEQELAELKRLIFGKRSEKMPRPLASIARETDNEKAQQTRSERRATRQGLPEVVINHSVSDEKRRCPKCGKDELK